jgi:APA family basic amino acid/polyamine antiporter
MAAAIMVSTFGCVNGLILSGARVGFAMARDGLFFRPLARLNGARVPARALWLQALWASALVLSGTYSQLLKYVVAADVVLYALLVYAVVALRRRRPDWPRPFRAPAYPWLQLAYCAAALALLAALLLGRFSAAWPGFLVLASGAPVYLWWRRRSSAGGT